MKVSLNWLNDHIDLSGLSTEEITDLLTFSGVEVEGVETTGVSSDLLVVAQIKSSDPHPDADKLSVCQVDDGSAEPRQIVCGAKNYKVGDHVPLALPGASFGDFKIKEGKLRGVISNGMMCSGKEIGVGTGDEGLLILVDKPAPGTLIRDLVESDTIFELEVTPNRPDCLSHLGIARELFPLTSRLLKKTPDHSLTEDDCKPASADEITIDSADDCPYYTARKITGIEVKESPEWLKTKLTSIGLRPINNVVDITNYVLMEMGHPLHAFDQAKLDGGIHVRRAADGEKLTALDGEEYSLTTDDLVIADKAKSLAIAGVMGGEGSGVTEGTTDILLESAYFAPSQIRQTSRRLNLSSDSSYRFERGTDPVQVLGASELAVRLILQIAGGTAEEATHSAGTPPELVGDVSLDPDYCRKVLGCDIDDDDISTVLSQLGLKTPHDGDGIAWVVPSYRLDLQRPIDLVEEVARIHGLDKIPGRCNGPTADVSKADLAYDFRLKLRRRLAAQGFYECTTLKLIAEGQLADTLGLGMRRGEVIRLKNPLVSDQTHMRNSIVPGLLSSVERNIRMGASDVRLFELGTCFLDEAKRPGATEIQQLAIAVAGKAAPASWVDPSPSGVELPELRGAIEALVPGAKVSFSSSQHDHFPLAAQVKIDGKPVGLAAQLAPGRAREIGASGNLLIAELDLAVLQRLTTGSFQVAELPKFPSITRDVAIEIAADLPAGDLDDFFSKQKEPLLVNVQLFDVFSDPSGEKLATDRRSVAYTLTYRDPMATMKAEQVDAAHAKILDALKAKFPIAIR